MLCRAKISAFLTLVSTLTAMGTPLNPELRNTTFQPAGAPGISKTAVLKPSAAAWSKTTVWPGVKVRKIAPGAPATGEVEISGFAFKQAPEAAVRPPSVKPAGGGR